MGKQWVHKKNTNNELVTKLAEELGVDQHIAKLLVSRNICTFEDAKIFFRPMLSQLHDPMLMKDMDKVVDRIAKAFENNEKILIFGDYDVDGTTAVAVVYSFLEKLHKIKNCKEGEESVRYYIPDRYEEGYGLSYKGIDYAAENGFTLMITLDCGIKANAQVDYANSKGIDVIIGDHHRPGNELPNAFGILDPKRDDCSYPYKELSGCGIGFKLIHAYTIKMELPTEDAFKMLDLVALSIASDIVPITGENRILMYYGLQLINTKPRPAFEAILRYSNVTKQKDKRKVFFNRELNVNDLVFLIGPRINAAGRMENGRDAVKLLLTQNIVEAEKKGMLINKHNDDRKNLDSQATQEAIAMIDNDEMLQKAKSTILFNKDWHKGVIGIVASRLTETYYKPTIIFTESNGLYTGSARSVKDFDVYDILDGCSDLLEHWGGHKYAAGLSLRPEKFAAFKEKFEASVQEKMKERDFLPEIEIDDFLDLQEITPKFCRILKQFAPFGPGNQNPAFESIGVKDANNTKAVGIKQDHLKLSIFQPNKSSFPLDGIAFQQGNYLQRIKNGELFDICYTIEENEWRGNVSIQLNVKDIRFK